MPVSRPSCPHSRPHVIPPWPARRSKRHSPFQPGQTTGSTRRRWRHGSRRNPAPKRFGQSSMPATSRSRRRLTPVKRLWNPARARPHRRRPIRAPHRCHPSSPARRLLALRHRSSRAPARARQRIRLGQPPRTPRSRSPQAPRSRPTLRRPQGHRPSGIRTWARMCHVHRPSRTRMAPNPRRCPRRRARPRPGYRRRPPWIRS